MYLLRAHTNPTVTFALNKLLKFTTFKFSAYKPFLLYKPHSLRNPFIFFGKTTTFEKSLSNTQKKHRFFFFLL